MYPNPNRTPPITIERAMERIIATLHSMQTDREKLKIIQTYSYAWLYGKQEPLP